MDISIKHDVSIILQHKPEFIRELIIVLGVVQLCKVMEVDSFEILINSFDLKSNEWWPLINEITEDEDWINYIEGDLYQTVLDLQLWLGNHEHDIREGSVLWFLMQKKKK